MEIFIRKPLVHEPYPGIVFDPDENMTEQSHRKECDVNFIVSRFQKTGLVTHLNNRVPQYIEVPEIDYHEALSVARYMEDEFLNMPSLVREYFDNDPAKFFQAVEEGADFEAILEQRFDEIWPDDSPASDRLDPSEIQNESSTSQSESSSPGDEGTNKQGE